MRARNVSCGALLALAFWACGEGGADPGPTDCVQGICTPDPSAGEGATTGGSRGGDRGGSVGTDGGGSGRASTGGTAGEQGGAPDAQGGSVGERGGSGGTPSEGGSTSQGGSTGGSTASGGSGPCVESWSCTPWETDGTSDLGTRSCADANACGTTQNRPREEVTLPALDFEFYQCNVEPVMNRKCSMLGCHGTERGRALRLYSRGRLRITGDALTTTSSSCPTLPASTPSEDCTGSIECRCYFAPHTEREWRRNYDSARGFALDAAGDPLAPGNEDASELVAQPIVGGKAHAGIHLFRDGDAEHEALRAWLGGATLETCDTNN